MNAYKRVANWRTVPFKLAIGLLAVQAAAAAQIRPEAGYLIEWGYVTSTGQPKAPTVLASNVISVAPGVYAALAAAVQVDGTVMEWCSDPAAHIPVQELETRETNRIVPALTNVARIALGREFGLALKQTGEVLTWGKQVQVGLSNAVAVAAAGNASIAVCKDGTVVEWRHPDHFTGRAEPVRSLRNVVAVAIGDGLADNSARKVALLRNGTVVQWGAKYDEEFAVYARPPAGLSNVVAVATSSNHTLALRADGTVVGWGANTQGQATGVPTKPGPSQGVGAGQTVIAGRPLTNIVSMAAAPGYSLALTGSGDVIAWGRMVNNLYPAYVPSGLSGVVFIAAGEKVCYAITTNPAVAVKWHTTKSKESP